jgi:hypothetical protein
LLTHECSRHVGSLHLEAPRTLEILRQRQIVQQRSDREDLPIVRDGLQLRDPRGKQP